MIDVTKLMYGNWILDLKNNRNVRVCGLDPSLNFLWANYGDGSGQYQLTPYEIEGIELTPELLEKIKDFHCRPEDNEYTYSNDCEITIGQIKESPANWFVYQIRIDGGGYIQYLHSLQNLIYCLTGKALEVKM